MENEVTVLLHEIQTWRHCLTKIIEAMNAVPQDSNLLYIVSVEQKLYNAREAAQKVLGYFEDDMKLRWEGEGVQDD